VAEHVGVMPYPALNSAFDALVPPDTKIEKIADDLMWSEGPLWDAQRKTLLFSDIPRNVVMQWNADKGVSRFLENSGYTGAAPFTGKEPGWIETIQLTDDGAVKRHGGDGFCAENEATGDEPIIRTMHAENGEWIGMRACENCSNLVCRNIPQGNAVSGSFRLFHPALQISLAYCRIVRSDENQPIRAVLQIAFLFHADGSVQSWSISRCACA